MKAFKSIIVVLCLVFFSVEGISQLGLKGIQHFSKRDYSGGIQNWDIDQSPTGRIYIANNDGILEYNGKTWRVFGLPNNTNVRSIAFDGKARLYAGGQNEVGYFQPDSSGAWIFTSLLESLPKEDQKFEDVWFIEVFQEFVLFGTSKKLIRLKDNRMEVILETNDIIKLHNYNEEAFFSNPEGLWKYDAAMNKFALIESLEDERLTIGQFDWNSEKYSITQTGQVYLNGRNTEPIHDFQKFIKDIEILCFTVHNEILHLGTARHGSIAVSLWDKEVFRFHIDNGLYNNKIQGIKADFNGDLWLASDNGIDLLQFSSPYSLVYPDNPLKGTGYDIEVINEIEYFATSNGLFELENTPSTINPNFREFDEARGIVWGLDQIDDNLIVCHQNGAFQLHNGELKSIYDKDGVWKFVQLKQYPEFVIAGSYSGLLLFNWDGNMLRFVKPLDGIPESCRIIEIQDNDIIWVSHPYRGAYKVDFNPKTQELNSVVLYTEQDGFPSNVHINVCKINEKILFTSENGLYEFNESSSKMQPFRLIEDGFREDERFMRAYSDNRSNIWYVTDSQTGMIKIEDDGLRRSFQQTDFSEIHSNMVGGFEQFYFSDDFIYINAEQGFLKTSNHQILEINQNLSEVKLESAILHGPNEILWNNLLHDSLSAELILPGHFQSISFSFVPNRYIQNKANTIEYKLEGYEDGWSEPSLSLIKEYTNLPSGEYFLKVKVNGRLMDFHQKITVKKKWHEQIWLPICILVLLAFLIVFLFRRSAKKFEKETKQLVEAQERELEVKNELIEREKLQKEKALIALEKDKLETEVQFKNKELASATMHLVQKGKMLAKIRSEIEALKVDPESKSAKDIQSILRLIDEDNRIDKNWDQFEMRFDQVHVDFLKRLKEQFPKLTPNDQKLCAYLRLNLTTKEIASIMNISVRGVEISRYRLRKKIGLEKSQNLSEFIMNI